MRNESFWQWFDSFAAPRLALREVSFRKIFAYLDSRDGPLTIVETGCARVRDNWSGDGQSTVIFDKYLEHGREGSAGHTVDLDPQATELCRSLVSNRFAIYTGDSVRVLTEIGKTLKTQQRLVDLLYLDSYDLDVANPTPSAVHHLKELVSIIGVVGPHTLVVVDDCPLTGHFMTHGDGQMKLVAAPTIGGKGTYVAEYAHQVGARLMFSHYQAAWTGIAGG